MKEREVLDYIKRKKVLTVADLQKSTGMGYSAARKYLLGLVEDGVVSDCGDGVTFKYIARQADPQTPEEEIELVRRGNVMDAIFEQIHSVPMPEEIPDCFEEEAFSDDTDGDFLSTDDEEELDFANEVLLEEYGDEKRLLNKSDLTELSGGITLDAVTKRLKGGFAAEEKDGKIRIFCGVNLPDGSPFQIGIKSLGSCIVLSDVGCTFKCFYKKNAAKLFEKKAAKILQDHAAARIDDEIVIKVCNIENVLADFLALYAAAARIVYLV